jgi:sialate O-acetylesterase
MIMKLIFLFLGAAIANAGPVLVPARPFSDYMVLPMDRKTPVWGMANAGADVKVSFGAHSTSGRANANGQWWIEIPAQKASSVGRDLEIRSNSDRLVFRDVLVGEVWLCAGQSNMDFPLAKAVGGKQEAAQAHEFPPIRLMNLTGTHTNPRRYTEDELQRLTPDAFFKGSWQIASEKSASGISPPSPGGPAKPSIKRKASPSASSTTPWEAAARRPGFRAKFWKPARNAPIC